MSRLIGKALDDFRAANDDVDLVTFGRRLGVDRRNASAVASAILPPFR